MSTEDAHTWGRAAESCSPPGHLHDYPWSQHQWRWGGFSCAKSLVGAWSGVEWEWYLPGWLMQWVWGHGSCPTSYTAGPEGCRLAQVPWASSGTERWKCEWCLALRGLFRKSRWGLRQASDVNFCVSLSSKHLKCLINFKWSLFKMKRHTVPGHLNPQGQYTFTEFLLDRGRFLTGTGFQGPVKTPAGCEFHVAPREVPAASILVSLGQSKANIHRQTQKQNKRTWGVFCLFVCSHDHWQ